MVVAGLGVELRWSLLQFGQMMLLDCNTIQLILQNQPENKKWGPDSSYMKVQVRKPRGHRHHSILTSPEGE